MRLPFRLLRRRQLTKRYGKRLELIMSEPTSNIFEKYKNDPKYKHDPGSALIRAALDVSVPLCIDEFKKKGVSIEWLQTRAKESAQILVEHGDVLFYSPNPQTPKGQQPSTAEVFNALTEGVACAALIASGGIKIFGLHFNAELDSDNVS